MKEFLLVLLASLVLATPSQESSPETESAAPDCTVLAWVRAEDLAPNHISRGELRIKVQQPQCATKVASVALRLQLHEFGEVKYLREGAVIPAIQRADNQIISDDSADWVDTVDAVYDYQLRDNAMTDPNLWVVKAEERRAWATEAVLIDHNPNISHPIIMPFVVASPAVNYPPVDATSSGWFSAESVSGHSYSDLGYVYLALVTFTDGRTVEVRAGHTTFQPAVPARSTQAFTWNVTFTDPEADMESPYEVRQRAKLERCLPKAQRSTFVGEITLHEGNVMRRGQLLKGRVVVHATSGSTTMSELFLSLNPLRRNHWANQQAAAGGDSNFYDSTTHERHVGSALSAEADEFSGIFDASNEYHFTSYPSSHGPLTSARPSLDFELQIPRNAPVDFQSYYARVETALHFSLTALYSKEVAACMDPMLFRDEPEDETSALNEAERMEEGLWDTYTHVGQPLSRDTWRRQLSLQANTTIPLVSDAVSSVPVDHYLTPGVLAPVLLAASQVDSNTIAFPAAQPVFAEEPFDTTAARLLRSRYFDTYTWMKNITNATFANFINNPTESYRAGAYAGLLWRKKIVAEERGIVIGGQLAPHRDASSQQQPFAAP